MSKFMKIAGTVIFGLIILIGVPGYYFVKSFDLNKYKSVAADMVENQLGRKLVINGDASIGISWVPTLIVKDIELSNPSWASNPQMVKVKEIELKFSLMPLFKKQIVIDKVVLDNPQIFLEESANGEVNWDFSKPNSKNNAKVASSSYSKPTNYATTNSVATNSNSTTNANMAKHPLAVMLAGFSLKNLTIDNGYVSYIDNKSKSRQEVVLNKVVMSATNIDAPMSAEFNVDYNKQNYSGSLNAGSMAELFDESKAFPVSLMLNAFGVDAALNGSAVGLMSGKIAYSFNLNAKNPKGNMGLPTASIQTLIEGNLEKISAKIERLNFANAVINGNVSVNFASKVPYINANLSSSLINLLDIEKNMKVSSYIPELISSANASQLVANTVIPYKYLNGINAHVNFAIGSLIIDNTMSVSNLNGVINLKNGVLNINPLKMWFGKGEVQASLMANSASQQVWLKVFSKNVKLQDIHKEFLVQNNTDFGILKGGDLFVDIDLHGSGATYRSLVDSFKGKSILILAPSIFQSGNLQFMTGNFISQLLNAINFRAKKSSEIDVQCAVIRADFAGGKVNFPKGIAFASNQLNLVSDGYINLNNDKINFNIRPFSGKIIDTNIAQAVANFIRLKGTIQSPKFTINDKEAMRAIIGTIATGGTAYVGSKLVLDTDSSPCYNALEGTPYQSMVPKPSEAQKAKEEIYKGTTEAVDKSVNVVKDTVKTGINDVLNVLKGL